MLPLFKYFVLYLCFVCSACGTILKKMSGESIDAGSNAIHCYCNLPTCITTSYMCKSGNGESGCFKKFERVTGQFFYGCLDSIVSKKHCSDFPKPTSTNSSLIESESFYECCFSDMCNNEITVQNSVTVDDIRINKSDAYKMKELLNSYGKSSSLNYYSNKEIWFRATLIAVPICGLMVLVMLIFIAVKMLRSDLPQNSHFVSTNLRKKFNAPDVNNVKITPQVENCYKSHLLPSYDKLDKKLSFVFKPHQEKYCDSRYVKYSNEKKSLRCNFEPTIHKKFSTQHLSILKIPHKINKLKNKNNSVCRNVYLSRKPCEGNKNFYDYSVVTIDSNINYPGYSLINNFIH